jgi:iron complex transport system substrate-binding protein
VRLAASLIALLLVLSACGAENSPAGTNGPAASRVGNPSELRIVTLAPHLAELVFAVGAGDTLVGVSSFTDYPDAALALPVVGDAFVTDRELLAILHPDLLLAWESGTPVHVIDDLRAAGFVVDVIRSKSLDDVATALEQIGELTGHRRQAREQADRFRDGIAVRRRDHVNSEPIRVFYQVAMRPLYTVNADHYISELISVCGGENIFSDLVDLAPMVAVEAVIERDPEVLLAGDTGQADTFDEWQRWPGIAANRYANHFLLPAAELGRPTPRLLLAADAMCTALATARSHRARNETSG